MTDLGCPCRLNNGIRYFHWDARFKMAGLPLLRVHDKYEYGHGSMLGKAAGLFTVLNVRGKEIDQGALMRYLNEMIWFPTAFLGENISWKPIDDLVYVEVEITEIIYNANKGV